MFVFRFEHDREICNSVEYGKGGKSLTGHGPVYPADCDSFDSRPNFGTAGGEPARIMIHERCAVTSTQFKRWISQGLNFCRYEDKDRCFGSDCCCYCSEIEDDSLRIPEGWHIIAYWVDDSKEYIDWRESYDQIVFNPAFAELIGSVELWEVDQFNEPTVIDGEILV